MLRSLYAGISGLRAEQTALGVISNNIANVNTTGFKSSSVNFADALSQTLRSASSPQGAFAGTNASQVGLGVRVGSIGTNLSQGTQQTTGNTLDTMIEGDGYFVTKSGQDTRYTRNGSLHLDANGQLSTADGGFVQGWTADAADDNKITTGVNPGTITISKTTMAPSTKTANAVLSGNLPSDAVSGTELTRNVTAYAADGSELPLSAKFTSTGNGNWSYTVGDGNGTAAGGTISSAGGKLTVTPDAQGNSTDDIAIDFTGMTGYAGTTSVQFDSQDGKAAGSLLSMSIGTDGIISGTFSNGAVLPVAQLAVATFTNPSGLEKAGNSNYSVTVDSGNARYGTAGSAGYGTVVSGALESSNVDLSQEFSNLIIAQRGFQANARVITTSDEVLQELAQLKR